MKNLVLKDAKSMTREEWVAACNQFMKDNGLNQRQFLQGLGFSRCCFRRFRDGGGCSNSTLLRVAFFVGGMDALIRILPHDPKSLQGKVWIYMAIGGFNQSDVARHASVSRLSVCMLLSDEWVDVSTRGRILSAVRVSCGTVMRKHGSASA